MKSKLKYFFAVIVSIYVLNTIGVPVYYHYCGGELESVTAVFKDNGCCEDEEEDADCCQSETKYISQKSESVLFAANYDLNPAIIDNSLFYGTLRLNEYSVNRFNSKTTAFNFYPSESGRTVLVSKSVLII